MKYESSFPPVLSFDQRELEKSFYIKDKKERLQFMYDVEKRLDFMSNLMLCENDTTPEKLAEYKQQKPSKNFVFKKDFEHDRQKFGFTEITPPGTTVCHVDDKPKSGIGMFYGQWWGATKRRLQIELYLDEIKTKASGIKNRQEKAFYLVEQRYRYHTGIFEDNPKRDKFHRDEYNEYLADEIRKELLELNETATATAEIQTTDNTIKWNANKNAIGTLFRALRDSGVIEGRNTDITSIIMTYFKDKNGEYFKTDTIKKSVELEITKGGKVNYSKSVYDAAKPLLDELKKQL